MTTDRVAIIMGVPTYLKTFFIPFYLLVGYIFIISGLIICFLMLLTYIFIWPFNRRLYRKICARLGYIHWSQLTFIAQWWSESDCVIVMDKPEDYEYIGKEHVIVLMNHRYDIDWLMAWVLAERFGLLGGSKIYGKSVLKMVPLIGWAWVFTESIFLKREWDKDKRIISRDLQYITDYPDNYWVTLLLFPEGTRFTDEKHKASNEVARNKGRPELKYHLLPRTKGFVHSMHGMKGKVPAILDMTIAFDEKNYAKPSLLSVLQGKKCQAEVFIRRIPLDSVPTDTDEECAEWLQKTFKEKDDIYDEYVQNGTFITGKKFKVPKRPYDLITWLLWASVLSIPLVYYAMKIINSGSLTLQIGAVVLLYLIYRGIRAMIAVSQTEKGSKYGKTDDINGRKSN